MKSFVNKIIIGVVIISIVVGCQTQHTETSILDNPTCDPPCWQNITPGLSTQKEFLDFLESYEYINQSSIQDYNAPWQGFDDLIRGRLQFDSKTITYFDIFILDDKVTNISFHGDWNITIDEAINRLGEPTNIIIIYYGNDVFVQMLIQARGIAFGYSTIDRPSSWKLTIQPDIRISSIDFFATDAYKKILDTGLFSYGLLESNETLKALHTWKGYGVIKEIYPSRIP